MAHVTNQQLKQGTCRNTIGRWCRDVLAPILFFVSESPEELTRIYVSVFDDDTCMACAAWHGVEFDVDAEVVSLPNPYCTCPQGCRCYWDRLAPLPS